MTHVGRKHRKGADDIIAYARDFLGPELTARREAEIAALPTITWRGRTLYTLRCNGTSGKGPHDLHVPLLMVWHLIHLSRFFCVYHAGDAWAIRNDTNQP